MKKNKIYNNIKENKDLNNSDEEYKNEDNK